MIKFLGNLGKNLQKFHLIFLIIPVLCYLFYYLNYAINVPHVDDYAWHLEYLLTYLHANFSHKIASIFSQHNEHRMIFQRLVTLFYFFLTGEINEKWLGFIGNLFFVALFVAWIWVLIKQKITTFYLLPVGFLLFQPQHWLNTFGFSLANFPVLLTSFLTLVFLQKIEKKYFVAAIFLAILSTLANGNGMFIFVAGIWIILLQKNWKKLIVWLLVASISVVFYFAIDFKFANENVSILARLLENPTKLLLKIIEFVGSIAEMQQRNSQFWAIFLGILTLGIVFWSIIKTFRSNFLLKKTSQNFDILPIFQAYFLFHLISIAATCLLRSVDNIVDYYKLYSALCVAVAVTIIPLSFSKSRVFTYFIAAFSVFFWIFSHLNYTNEVILNKNNIASDMINWQLNKKNLRSLAAFGRFDAEFRIRLMDSVFQQKIYQIPAEFLVKKVEEDQKNIISLQENLVNGYYVFKNDTYETSDGTANWQTFIGFKNADSKWYLQATEPIFRSVRHFLPASSVRRMGLQFTMYKPYLESVLEHGEFQLFICHFNRNVIYCQPTKQIFKL